MVQFIMWSKTIDVKFRDAYYTKTGEKIQKNPIESEDGLSYMVGSSRVSQVQLDELQSDIEITTKETDIKTRKNIEPSDWVAKVAREDG